MPGVRCRVNNCKNTLNSSKDHSISFHRFPKNPLLRRKWVRFTRRPGKWSADTSYICSAHFKKEDFERNLRAELLESPIRRKILKRTAVPTLLHGEESLSEVKEERRKRYEERERKRIVEELLAQSEKKKEVKDHENKENTNESAKIKPFLKPPSGLPNILNRKPRIVAPANSTIAKVTHVSATPPPEPVIPAGSASKTTSAPRGIGYGLYLLGPPYRVVAQPLSAEDQKQALENPKKLPSILPKPDASEIPIILPPLQPLTPTSGTNHGTAISKTATPKKSPPSSIVVTKVVKVEKNDTGPDGSKKILTEKPIVLAKEDSESPIPTPETKIVFHNNPKAPIKSSTTGNSPQILLLPANALPQYLSSSLQTKMLTVPSNIKSSLQQGGITFSASTPVSFDPQSIYIPPNTKTVSSCSKKEPIFLESSTPHSSKTSKLLVDSKNTVSPSSIKKIMLLEKLIKRKDANITNLKASVTELNKVIKAKDKIIKEQRNKIKKMAVEIFKYKKETTSYMIEGVDEPIICCDHSYAIPHEGKVKKETEGIKNEAEEVIYEAVQSIAVPEYIIPDENVMDAEMLSSFDPDFMFETKNVVVEKIEYT